MHFKKSRPIRLSTADYKILAHILVNKAKPILPDTKSKDAWCVKILY